MASVGTSGLLLPTDYSGYVASSNYTAADILAKVIASGGAGLTVPDYGIGVTLPTLSSFSASLVGGLKKYAASTTGAPTSNAGTVLVMAGSVTDDFLARDDTTGIWWSGTRSHGSGAIAWAAVGIAKPSDVGLVGRWTGDAVPDWPDGASPTYFENAFTAATGWSALDTKTATPTAAGGELLLAVGASPGTYVSATRALAVSSKTVRIRWRCAKSDLTTLEIGTSGAGTHVSKSIAGLTSGVIDITTGANFTDFEVIFNASTNFGASNTVYIDWIYVGDGTYSSLLLDDSGNGNHGTIAGPTPTEGIIGRALSFDGTDDYVSIPQSAGNRAKRTVAFWINSTAAMTSKAPVSDDVDGGGFSIIPAYDISSSTFKTFIGYNGTSVYMTNSFNLIDGNWHHVVVVWDRTVSAARLKTYVDGVHINSGAVGDYDLDVVGNPYKLGRFFNSYSQCSIADFRIYNGAPSASEVMGLYLTKGAGPSCNKKAVTAVPNSLVVRGSGGTVTRTTLGLTGTLDAETLGGTAAAAFWRSSSGTGGSDGNGGKAPAAKTPYASSGSIAQNAYASVTLADSATYLVTAWNNSQGGAASAIFKRWSTTIYTLATLSTHANVSIVASGNDLRMTNLHASNSTIVYTVTIIAEGATSV